MGVVGLGLIGGSIARAMARGGHEVYAFDLNEDIESFAAIETTSGTLTDKLVPTCELIVLACYPKACVDWLRGHAALVSPDAIVIDTGGVKRSICEPCFAIAREAGITFVGCHPMAGTQFSGYAHSRANMFAARRWSSALLRRFAESSALRLWTGSRGFSPLRLR